MSLFKKEEINRSTKGAASHSFLSLLMLLILPLLLGAQQPDTIWTRTYGGSWDDEAHAMVPSSDGDYTIFGYTGSFGSGGYDMLVIHVDSSGNEIWSRSIGGIYDDIAYDAAPTADGGFIIAGKTWPAGAMGFDVYLAKTDSLGDTLWTRHYGGVYDDAAYAVTQTSDGGYLLAGGSETAARTSLYTFILKTDALGDTLWTRRFGGTSGDMGQAVHEHATGEYYIAGRQSNMASLMKLDSLGVLLWERTFNGDIFHSLASVSETTLIMIGEIMVMTDLNGDTIWTTPTGGKAFQQTKDRGFIIAGGTEDIELVRADKEGNTIWQTLYGGTGDDAARAVAEVADSVYLIAGTTNSYGAGFRDVYLIKTKPYPRLSYTPRLYSDTLWADQSSTQTIPIGNTGNIHLDWTLAEQTPVRWISIPDTSGTIAPGDSDSIAFRFVSYNLDYGDYLDTLLLKTNDMAHSCVKIPAYLVVLSPDMEAAPLSFGIILQPNQSIDQYLRVINNGNYRLRFNIDEHPTVEWLSVAPTSDSVAPGDTAMVVLTLNSSGLGFGQFSDTLRIGANYGGYTTIPVTVHLTVVGNMIGIDPPSVSVACRDQQTAAETISIWNSGEIPLAWSLTEVPAAGWLTENPASGSIGPWSRERVVLTFHTAGLSQGIYCDTLMVFSNCPEEEPISVPIRLSVFTNSNPFLFPNPFCPDRGHSVITFSNLPAYGQIEVFSISGYRIWEISLEDASDHFSWDARTGSGKTVASGTYQYVIKQRSGKIIGRGLLSIIR